MFLTFNAEHHNHAAVLLFSLTQNLKSDFVNIFHSFAKIVAVTFAICNLLHD